MNPLTPHSGSLPRQRVAVIGSGISGLASAWLLNQRHEVHLFERRPRFGGHACTVDIAVEGQQIPVDVGFIVFNRPNYPHFARFLDALNVPTRVTDMSFGVSLQRNGRSGTLEYGSRYGAWGLFAQNRNWFNPRYIAMLLEVWRYMKAAQQHLALHQSATPRATTEGSAEALSLGSFLERGGFSRSVIEDHILPMAAAIWSGTANRLREFPAHTFFQFFRNHGLLGVNDWLTWETVAGGSRNYVERALAALPAAQVHGGLPIHAVRRGPFGVMLEATNGASWRFDQVIFACHSDEALALLGDQASSDERQVLSAIRFQDNQAVLHGDRRWLPRRRRAWSAWNYVGQRQADLDRPATVSYWMNLLQGLPTRQPVILTLNPSGPIDPARQWRTLHYRHPQFDAAAIVAQQRLHRLQGQRFSWFTGAWTGFGFHEDGIQSAVSVARAFGCPPVWAADVAEEISSARGAAQGARLMVPERRLLSPQTLATQ